MRAPDPLPTLADRERDSALAVAGLSVTVADARLPDQPLVYVNAAFKATTGYAPDEVLGRNCRFLQGPDTDPEAVRALRDALDGCLPVQVTLLNYRKDGSTFWNQLSLNPIEGADGRCTHVVGVQVDVSSQVLAEAEREAHLHAERAARQLAERAQERLALLSEVTSLLASTLDVDEALEQLTALLVPAVADACTLDLVAEGDVRRVSSRYADPALAEPLAEIERRQPTGLTDASMTNTVLAGAPAQLLGDVPEDYYEKVITDPALAQSYRRLGMLSAAVVPLQARGQVLGALGLLTTTLSGRTYDDRDLDTFADFGRRAGLAVDNARLYGVEHHVAATLQRSMLPDIPDLPGVEIGKDYLPSSSAAEVGGDWYDVLPLPDGTVGLAVGDVMGHDLGAAAAMGQLRSVLRSYAWKGSPPAAVLHDLDDLVQGLQMAPLATSVFAKLDLAAGTLTYANAGHLPPALRLPDGTVQLLDDVQDVLLGAVPGADRSERTLPVPPGSTLVLYTDGLVEDRHRDLEDGLERLVSTLASAPDGAQDVCDALTRALTPERRGDDVAVLVVKVS